MFRNLAASYPHRLLDTSQLVCSCISVTHPWVPSRPTPNVPQVRCLRMESTRRSAAKNQRFRSKGELTKGDDQPQLPRYLRREALYSGSPAPRDDSRQQTKKRPSSQNTPAKPVYRSRHHNPSHEKAESEIRFLEPYVLSSRLKKLCDAGKIDAAVTLLKNTPLDAQNPPVWNTLIWECMKAKRFKLSYQLFIDMKRRGFSPTTRTFQTMFAGLSRIEIWSSHPKQLANAHSIYDAFQRHMNSVKKDDPNSPELSVDPLAAYIKLLGNAGRHQEIFDVYYNMDSQGPLAPNKLIYTAMFQALSIKYDASSSTRNAANAKLLWTQMQKASQKSPGFEVDAFIVTPAVAALSRGRPSDQKLAFKIVHDYFGLTAPDDPPSAGTLPLTAQSFAAVLLLCKNTQQHSLCDHFLQQVKKRRENLGGVSILDRAHLEEVLKARLALPEAGSARYCLETLEWMLRQEITGGNGPRIRPAITTFNLALTACWRDGDWKSATRLFDLMTGYHAHDFMDGAVAHSPRLDRRAAGRNLVPTAETLSSLVRTALANKDRASTRQCLRIVDYLNASQLFLSKTRETVDESHKTTKNRAFYTSKLASAIVDAVAYISNPGGKSSKDELIQWRDLADRAEEALRRSSAADFIPTLEERHPKTGLTKYGKTL